MMKVDEAKKLVSDLEEAQRVIKEEERKQNELRKQAKYNEVSIEISEGHYVAAIKLIKAADELTDAQKDQLHASIKLHQDNMVRATLPDRVIDTLACYKCGVNLAIIEGLVDNGKIILIGFCEDCNKRTVLKLPRDRFGSSPPIERFLSQIPGYR